MNLELQQLLPEREVATEKKWTGFQALGWSHCGGRSSSAGREIDRLLLTSKYSSAEPTHRQRGVGTLYDNTAAPADSGEWEMVRELCGER
jgi:hypothetical protein